MTANSRRQAAPIPLAPPGDDADTTFAHGVRSPNFPPTLRDPFNGKIHQPLPQADSKEQDHDAEHDAVILGQARDGIV